MSGQSEADEWAYTEESPGKVCPFGHPWDANDQIAALQAQVEQGVSREAALRELLRRIREWDHLPLTGDGPYWMREIDRALSERSESDQ